MLLQQTIEKLHGLNLRTMAGALAEEIERGNASLTFEERLGLIVDMEWSARQARRCSARLRAAKLRQNACVADIDYRTPRNLDRAVMQDLTTCRWIKAGRNVIITGPAGVGKSWLASCLGDQACRDGFAVQNFRVTRLVEELAMARADGSFLRMLARIAKLDLLILDDWGLADLDVAGYHGLLEVLDDRVGKRSTLVTSQLPTSLWYDKVGNPTVADAILDRLLPNAVLMQLKGESLRKKRPSQVDESRKGDAALNA
jgi:DNA replication protein DnaC